MRMRHAVCSTVVVVALLSGGCTDEDNGSGLLLDGSVGLEGGSPIEGGVANGLCRGTCFTPEQCLANEMCVEGACVQCTANDDCDTSTFRGGCDEGSGRCLICGDDTDCTVAGTPLATGRCDVQSGECIACDTDAECDFTASPYVGCLNGVCVECTSDADCPPGGMTGCAPSTGTCTLCRADDECCRGVPGCGLTCAADGQCLCATDPQCEAAFGGVSDLVWSCQPI